jgi:hypothetical protein
MKACRSVCGPTRLAIPARRAIRRTIRPGRVPVEALPVRFDEDRAHGALTDGEIDRPGHPRCERQSGGLATLAHHGEGAVAALEAEGFDVGSVASDTRSPFNANNETRA